MADMLEDTFCVAVVFGSTFSTGRFAMWQCAVLLDSLTYGVPAANYLPIEHHGYGLDPCSLQSSINQYQGSPHAYLNLDLFAVILALPPRPYN